MAAGRSDYESVRRVLERAEEPLTAREILDAVDDPALESAHRVATVLGRRAEDGDVEVIREQPYRYRLSE